MRPQALLILTVVFCLFFANEAECNILKKTAMGVKTGLSKEVVAAGRNVTINEVAKGVGKVPMPQIDNILIPTSRIRPVVIDTSGISQARSVLSDMKSWRLSLRIDNEKFLRSQYRLACSSDSENTSLWFRMGYMAAYLGVDSIASDCFNRYSELNVTPTEVYHTIIALSEKDRKLVAPIVNNIIEREFRSFDYWKTLSGRVVSLSIQDINVIDTLAQMGGKHCRPLVDAMRSGVNGDEDCFRHYLEALNNAINDSCYNNETCVALYKGTLRRMVEAQKVELYPEILALYQNEYLQDYVANDFAMAYSLYLIAHISGCDTVEKYYNICVALDENKLVEYYNAFYQSVYNDFISNPKDLLTVNYLLYYWEEPLSQSLNICCDLYDKMIADIQSDTAIYCSKEDTIYKKAILYTAEMGDSIAGDNFSPTVAYIRFMHGCAKAMFEDTTDEGCREIMEVYDRLYAMPDRNAEYQQALAAIGIEHADFIDRYKGRTRDAKKMIENLIPIIKQCNDETLIGLELEIVIDFYNRHNKLEKALKMQKLLEELSPSYSANEENNQTQK